MVYCDFVCNLVMLDMVVLLVIVVGVIIVEKCVVYLLDLKFILVGVIVVDSLDMDSVEKLECIYCMWRFWVLFGVELINKIVW